MAKKPVDVSKFNKPTEQEDAQIHASIADDPDTWEAPETATVRRRGRPAGSNKSQVTIKLDNDVLAALKSPKEKGWQTRANALLRQALGV